MQRTDGLQQIADDIANYLNSAELEEIKKILILAKTRFIEQDGTGDYHWQQTSRQQHKEKADSRFQYAEVEGMNADNLKNVLIALLTDPDGGTYKNSLKSFILRKLLTHRVIKTRDDIDFEQLGRLVCEKLAKNDAVLNMDEIASTIFEMIASSSEMIGSSIQRARRRYVTLDWMGHFIKETARKLVVTDTLHAHENLLAVLTGWGNFTNTSLKGLTVKELFVACKSQFHKDVADKFINHFNMGILDIEGFVKALSGKIQVHLGKSQETTQKVKRPTTGII